MDRSTVGFVVFVVSVFVGRAIANNAQQKLATEEKAVLLDSVSGLRIYSFGAMLALGIAASVRPKLGWLVVPVIAGMILISCVRVSRAALPRNYRRAYGFNCAICLAGIAAATAIVWW